GVALADLDVLDRDAQLRRQDLRVGGGVSLAMIVGAEHGAHRAIRLDPDGGRLVEADARAVHAREARGRNARRFDVAGDTDAAQPTLALGLGPALREAVVVGDRKRTREDLGK